MKNLFLFLNDFSFFSSFFFFLFFFKKKFFYINCYSKKKINKKIKYKFFISGYVFFYDLFLSIINAKKNIFAEFYIIRNDFLGKKFLKLLIDKSYKKIVILVVDNIGTKINFNLKKIFFFIYNKKKFFLNNRNHKKIVFIDNKILWIGGNNIGKEYLGLNKFIGYWNDFHCKIENIYPNFIIKKINFKKIKSNFNIKKIEISKKFFFYDNCKKNFLDIIIFFIKKEIKIMSPYIILDLELINFIKILKKKNIEIKVYVSYKSDNIYTQLSSLIFLKYLIKLKIKIFFLKNGFYHRKIYLIDKKYLIFGSMNFDIRSVYINEECLFIINNKNLKKKIFLKIKKNFLFNIINYKKKNFFIKFIYIVSFINYFSQ